MLANECKKELEQRIIPFWNKLKDDEFGGFYGFVGNDLQLDKKADKGVILHARILWFYSNCYTVLGEKSCLDYAKHAYDFLVDYAFDREEGGVYWSLSYDGKVVDDMKHTYCQAFVIYALASYYEASGDKKALDLAFNLVDTVEGKTLDQYGYMEAFDKKWNLLDYNLLSENGLIADKTMNTVLHLLEAYTELYRVSPDERVLERLKFQLDTLTITMFDKENSQLKVFFDTQFNTVGDIHSYGHDIEATWLIDRACEVIGDEEITRKIRLVNHVLVENIAKIAFENGALNNERENEKIDKTRIWWVQAEGVVGFYNAFEKYGDSKFLDIATSLWEYIKGNIIDKRQGGEWHSEVFENGEFSTEKPVVDPWKCPYHNGRMCLEIITREKANN